MYSVILAIACFCAAAVCSAGMDTLAHHFSLSIFSRKNQQWWNPDISWYNKYRNKRVADGLIKWRLKILKITLQMDKPVFLTDAWHCIKSIQICLVIASIIFTWNFEYIPADWEILACTGVCLGILWNLCFDLCYNRLFLLRNHRNTEV